LYLYISAYVTPFFFYYKIIFPVHLSYFSLFSILPTLHSTETALGKLCGIVGKFRCHKVCPTNLPLSRNAKNERTTLLHLSQFFHHQICYTPNLLLDKVRFSPPSSTNAWKLIPYMYCQRGSPAL